MTEAELKTAAVAKARGSAALEKAWLTAILRMASTGICDDSLRKLSGASSSPVAFSRLAARIASDVDSNVSKIANACDQSCHSLEDWLEAIDAIYDWLEKRSRATPFYNAVGYVACASEVSKNESLPKAVKKMLDEYGVD